MGPDFLYSKGRIPASVDFITKEMDDFNKFFSGITWKDYRMLDSINAKALERTVENILTALIEVSGTISIEEGKIVKSYHVAVKEATLILNFNEADSDILAKLASHRNRLAHRYLDFKWEVIKAYKDARPLIKEFLTRTILREKQRLLSGENGQSA